MNTLGYLTSGIKARMAREGIPTRQPLVNLSAGHVLLIYAPRRRKPEWWIVLDEGAESGGTSASAHQAIRLSPSVPPSISQLCITSRGGAEGGEGFTVRVEKAPPVGIIWEGDTADQALQLHPWDRHQTWGRWPWFFQMEGQPTDNDKWRSQNKHTGADGGCEGESVWTVGEGEEKKCRVILSTSSTSSCLFH